MPNIKVPGVVWAALLVALAAFLQANFEHAVWYQIASVVIIAILKYLDVGMEHIITTVLRPPLPGDSPEIAREAWQADSEYIHTAYRTEDQTALTPVARSKVVRWLVG